MESKHALAQFVSTSCLNGTFYTSDKDQLEIVKKLMVDCDPEFLGKLAVYGRQVSFMKDMPSLLCAYLAGEVGKAGVKSETQDRKTAVLRKIFPHVIDNGKMLCNFVQMVRSGQFGRKNMGHCASKLVSEWFESRSPASIFRQSIGNNPSLGDVIKLTRPKPNTPEKAALFAYLCGSKIETDGEGGKHLRSYYKDIKDNTVKLAHQHPFGALPEIVLEYEAWKADRTRPTPKLDFDSSTTNR
jgi:60 kDa SS-A/Ro ribonucleoprotein